MDLLTVSDGCVGKEVGSVPSGLKGTAGEQVEGEGSRKQPSSCGIVLFLARTTALLLEQVASLMVCTRFHGGWASCGGASCGWASCGGASCGGASCGAGVC